MDGAKYPAFSTNHLADTKNTRNAITTAKNNTHTGTIPKTYATNTGNNTKANTDT